MLRVHMRFIFRHLLKVKLNQCFLSLLSITSSSGDNYTTKSEEDTAGGGGGGVRETSMRTCPRGRHTWRRTGNKINVFTKKEKRTGRARETKSNGQLEFEWKASGGEERPYVATGFDEASLLSGGVLSPARSAWLASWPPSAPRGDS